MKTKLRILSLVSLAFISCNLVSAANLDKARELMELMQITGAIDASLAQVEGFADRMIESQNLTPEQVQEAKALSRKSMQASMQVIKSIDWNTMFAEIYADVFSEEELQALIDFYQSDVGQKFLEKQPQLMQATMSRMQSEMGKLMPQIQQDVMEAVQEASSSANPE